LDHKDPAILYVFDIEGNNANKKIVKLENPQLKRKRNEVTSAGIVETDNLHAIAVMSYLWGAWIRREARGGT
jgi:predicted rRNA methylase YqxC with S4 and FtsJ domains